MPQIVNVNNFAQILYVTSFLIYTKRRKSVVFWCNNALTDWLFDYELMCYFFFYFPPNEQTSVTLTSCNIKQSEVFCVNLLIGVCGGDRDESWGHVFHEVTEIRGKKKKCWDKDSQSMQINSV